MKVTDKIALEGEKKHSIVLKEKKMQIYRHMFHHPFKHKIFMLITKIARITINIMMESYSQQSNNQMFEYSPIIKKLTITIPAEIIWIRKNLQKANLYKTYHCISLKFKIKKSNYLWNGNENKPVSKVLQLDFVEECHLMPTYIEILKQKQLLQYCNVCLLWNEPAQQYK